ncbi:threonine/serine ThrE exporter family protein [Arthrobacter mobilis]|uniref:threonine/serine ThrE exporter family protein n=1 Tax=Arthrobacter mobilis TaxID=2724944 RepID=UPI0035E43647
MEENNGSRNAEPQLPPTAGLLPVVAPQPPRQNRKPVPKQTKPVPAGTVPLRVPRTPPRHNAAARRMLRKLVQSEAPPTAPMTIVDRLAGSPYANPMIQAGGVDASARQTLDLALDLAEAMFRYGAGALEAETSIIAVTAAFGLRNVEVDITNQSVVINYAKPDAVPLTVMRVVRSWTNNYAGLSQVHQLVTDIVRGHADRAEARRRIDEITRQPKPYPRWVASLASAVFAGTIVAFIGGSFAASAVAVAASLLVELASRTLGRWRIPDFFTTAAGSCIVTFLALAFWQLQVPLSPAIVVAGGIIMLLPTGRLVSAVQDAINGFPVTAAGRFLSAFLTFGALVAGISVGLVAGSLAGIRVPDVLEAGAGGYPVVVQALLAMLATALVCVTEQTRPAMIVPTALVALLGFAVYALVQAGGLGDRLSPAVAAVFIGFAARLVALKLGSPQLVVAVPALLFLLPGFAIFRSMYTLTVPPGDPITGMFVLFSALTVILAMAGGAVLGDHLARPLTRGWGSNEGRRNRRR